MVFIDGLLVGWGLRLLVLLVGLGRLGPVARVPQLLLLEFVQVLVLVLQLAQRNTQLVHVLRLLFLPLLLDYLLDLLLLFLLLPPVYFVNDDLLQLSSNAALEMEYVDLSFLSLSDLVSSASFSMIFSGTEVVR